MGLSSLNWLSLDSGLRDQSNYLASVDVLRGWAISLVFFFHAWGISGGPDLGTGDVFLLSYIEAGRTGVTLFFVISGFLLSIPWFQAAAEGRPPPGLKNYYLARALRIVPLYYCAVLLACFVSGDWWVGLQAFAFQFVGFDIFPFSVVWWTLATELQFYVVLPFLMWLLLGGGARRDLFFCILIAWIWLYSSQVIWNLDGQELRSFFLTKSLFGRLPAFLLGISAAWVFLRFRHSPDGVCRCRWVGVVALSVSVIILDRILRETIVVGEWRSESTWHIHHTYEAVLWSIVVLVAVSQSPVRRLGPVRRYMAYIGKISYSLYLWHVPVLFFLIYPVKARLDVSYLTSIWFYVLPLMAMVLSILASLMTYRWIELPFLNLKKRLPV